MRVTEEPQRNVSADFMPRRYFDPLKQILPYYLTSIALIIGGLQLYDWLGLTATSILAFIMISASFIVVFFRMQQSNDLAMTHDFQNMLFASAASIGSSFCFFLRHDGTIIYANDGTRKLFQNFNYKQHMALDSMLSEAGVEQADITQFYSALRHNKKTQLIFALNDHDGSPRNHIIIIEPLQRPAGYFVVHGRPFNPDRQGQVKLPGALGQTQPQKLEQLLDELPVGIYVSNETGILEYANIPLEQYTRYEPRELSNGSHSIQTLVYHADGYEPSEFDRVNFTGNVLLNCRNKSLTQGFLVQRKITDSSGNISGYYGIITPLT